MTASGNDSFISVVAVLNESQPFLPGISSVISTLSSETSIFEIHIVINGASQADIEAIDVAVESLELENLVVTILAAPIDKDEACVVGLHQVIGDYVVILETEAWDSVMPLAMNEVEQDCEAVFIIGRQSNLVQWLNRLYVGAYLRLEGVQLPSGPALGRVMSRKVVNTVLEDRWPALALRHMPANMRAGYKEILLEEDADYGKPHRKLARRVARGFTLLFSTATAPLKMTTYLAVLGIIVSLGFGLYGVTSRIWNQDIEPGWFSLNIQMSLSLLLISSAVFVVSGSLLSSRNRDKRKPFVLREISTNPDMTIERLNVEHTTRDEQGPW